MELGLGLSFEGSHHAGMMTTLQAASQAQQIGVLARFMQLPSLALWQLWGKFQLSTGIKRQDREETSQTNHPWIDLGRKETAKQI